jgi:hypothetical protein
MRIRHGILVQVEHYRILPQAHSSTTIPPMKKSKPATPPGLIIPKPNEHGMIAIECQGDESSDIFPIAAADLDRFIAVFKELLPKVHFDFAPTAGPKPLSFSPEEQSCLCRKVALHWMYFYHFNKMPMKVGKRDLEHPQTYQIVHQFAGDKLGHNTPEAAALAAKCLGMTVEYFNGWLERDRQLGDAF